MFSGRFNIIGSSNGNDITIGAEGDNVKGGGSQNVWVCEDKGGGKFTATVESSPGMYLGHGNTNNAKLTSAGIELLAEDCDDGSYMFMSTSSGLYLTVANNPTDNVKFTEKDPIKPPKQKYKVILIVSGGGYTPEPIMEPKF